MYALKYVLKVKISVSENSGKVVLNKIVWKVGTTYYHCCL